MELNEIYRKYLECGGKVSTDSRQIEAGQIFIAIRGERFDGNNFVSEVLDKGAALVIADSVEIKESEKVVLVEDSLKTLQQLANHHRKQLKIPVLAITGSNGKTTTKELIAAVLQTKYKIHATKGNFNNHLGVPLTLLAAPLDTELMIVEMGANHVGEIAELSEIAAPSLGLITNIGQAHLEGFGSYEGVIQAKTELYKFLRSVNGTILYNPNDAVLFNNLPDGSKTKRYVSWIEFNETKLCLSIRVKYTDQPFLDTKLVGAYNGINMLCAATVGEYFGIKREQILEAITSYLPTNNRSQIVIKKDAQLILDAYNANPSSMKSSIRSFAESSAAMSKVLVLGDMKELGGQSIDLHREILDFLAQYQWKHVILVGNDFSIADKAQKYIHYTDIETLSKSPKEILTMLSNSISLIKASRSIKLEQIEALFD